MKVIIAILLLMVFLVGCAPEQPKECCLMSTRMYKLMTNKDFTAGHGFYAKNVLVQDLSYDLICTKNTTICDTFKGGD
jgi:hypothetical protein